MLGQYGLFQNKLSFKSYVTKLHLEKDLVGCWFEIMLFNNLTSPSITRLNTQKGLDCVIWSSLIWEPLSWLCLLMKRLQNFFVIYPFLLWTVAGLSQCWSVLLFFKEPLVFKVLDFFNCKDLVQFFYFFHI